MTGLIENAGKKWKVKKLKSGCWKCGNWKMRDWLSWVTRSYLVRRGALGTSHTYASQLRVQPRAWFGCFTDSSLLCVGRHSVEVICKTMSIGLFSVFLLVFLPFDRG